MALLGFGVAKAATIDVLGGNDNKNNVFRWSSTGGGWRSMFATVGYANVFQQAGLLSQVESLFSGIVSTV